MPYSDDLIIPPDSCNNETILQHLNAAFLEVQVDNDGDLYVTEGLEFPTWIGAVPGQPLLRIYTHTQFDQEFLGEAEISRWADTLTGQVIVPGFFSTEGRLEAIYHMSCIGGLSVRQMVCMLRRFASAFAFGVRKVEQGALLRPLRLHS